MLFITRKEHFSSSHRLENQNLNTEKNAEIFGKCNNFHGHNYYLEVTLQGTPDKVSGYVMDLKLLKSIIQDKIISKVDHKFLNDVEMLDRIIPTTENLAIKFWEILEPAIKCDNAKLYSIKLYETDKNSVTYKGGNPDDE